MEKNCLIVIDVQNDFMDIPNAALPVTGAVEDAKRLAGFIGKVPFQTIISSLDSHYVLDIAHPSWWNDSRGNTVNPFTPISSDDVKSGKYVPRIDPKHSLKYLEDLEANGEFTHFIWPEHCIIGTNGHNLFPVYANALKEWSSKNLKWVNFIQKGQNPFTEHFGIFRANVQLPDDSSTQINQGLFQHLNVFDNLFLAGQARSHCVLNSLKQLLEFAPNLASKIVILEDAMSDVQGLPSDFYDYVNGIYADAKSKGVKFEKTTNF